ncbi:MAG TPA: transglycosylase SLT domain-containing protein [Gemmatimonadales bacterium]|jgi:soluble lytic murein transglycosylase
MRRFVLIVISLLAVQAAAAQSPTALADSAISAGQPWRASQQLAPLLASPESRTPDVIILAARAAAAWEGWTTVQHLLEHEPWLNLQFDRLGDRLLAEAALADNRNSDALTFALLASTPGDSAREPLEQARRNTLVARAYDRLNQLDSAATWYRRASTLLPELGDWFALRAAAVTADSASRGALYAGIALPAAIPRIAWTEAGARDRTNDFDGAAARYDRLGARVQAIRVRWRGAVTDSARAALATDLAMVLRAPSTSTAEARDALDLILQITPPFTDADRLVVARRAATVIRPQDAVNQFALAAQAAPLSAKDRVIYGSALGALQRWPEAAAQFAGITDPAIAGLAAYYRARALMRGGQQDAVVAALRQVVRRFPRDTAAASTALYLLADLTTDAGSIDSARAYYLKIAARYPSSSQRSHATLLAALIAFAKGKPAVTVRELSRALAAHAVPSEIDAARYWLARASLATGDTATAHSIWRELITKGPDSYYAVRSAARLDTLPWPSFGPDSVPAPDSLNGVFDRATLLDHLGMAPEAKLERDRLAADAHTASDFERVAQAFAAHGFAARASQLGARAVATGLSRDATLWRLIYPMPFATTLDQVAAQEHVDPLLVAAIIRQESAFDPHATSRTNARGLMQVEPTVGRDLARILGFPDFDPALLWIGPVNLVLGIHHFAAALTHYPEVERSVAAYNAGNARVDHWSATPLNGRTVAGDQVRAPVADIDLFVERIPFVETREYVRAIVRNHAVYQMIYGAHP